MASSIAARVALRYRRASLPETVRQRVIELLVSAKGSPLEDSKVHALAAMLGMPPDVLESEIYAFASIWAMNDQSVVNIGGRAEEKGVTANNFPKADVERGADVEMEHTKDRRLARKIALDHLAEFSNYYAALEKMEADLRAGKKF